MTMMPTINNLTEFSGGLLPNAIRPLLLRAKFIQLKSPTNNSHEKWVFHSPRGNDEENIEFDFDTRQAMVPAKKLRELQIALQDAIELRSKHPNGLGLSTTASHAGMSAIANIDDPAEQEIATGKGTDASHKAINGHATTTAGSVTDTPIVHSTKDVPIHTDLSPALPTAAATIPALTPLDATSHLATPNTPTSQPQKTEKPMNLPVKETFGYKVGYRRVERDMSEEALANAVKEIATERKDVDAAMVRGWETNQDLPSQEMYDALVQVLVIANDKVTDKEAAQAELGEAYKAAKEAKDNGQPLPNGFANKLWNYRDQLDVTERTIAEAVKTHLKSDVEESPEKIDKFMMLDINTGAHRPSLGMVRAIVRALDSVKPLSVEEKADIFNSFAPKKILPLSEKAIIAQNGHAEGVSTSKMASDEVLECKSALANWLASNAEGLSGSELARKIEIPQSAFSRMFGANNTVRVGTDSAKLIAIGKKVEDFMQERGVAPESLAEFRNLFAKLVDATERDRSTPQASRG